MATTKAKFEKLKCLPNCCGAFGTMHILIFSSAHPNNNLCLEEESMNNMVLQAIVDPYMRFKDIVSGWPGSWRTHASCVPGILQGS
jgi:hypothetical protein